MTYFPVSINKMNYSKALREFNRRALKVFMSKEDKEIGIALLHRVGIWRI